MWLYVICEQILHLHLWWYVDVSNYKFKTRTQLVHRDFFVFSKDAVCHYHVDCLLYAADPWCKLMASEVSHSVWRALAAWSSYNQNDVIPFSWAHWACLHWPHINSHLSSMNRKRPTSPEINVLAADTPGKPQRKSGAGIPVLRWCHHLYSTEIQHAVESLSCRS